MIQRIQSVYLLISFLVLSLMLFFPLGMIDTHTYVVHRYDAFTINVVETDELIVHTFPIAVLAGISALISLITIFLYKKRMVQKRLGVLNILLLIGLIVLLYVYPNYLSGLDIMMVNYKVLAAMPIIAIILTLLANRAIQKDENLVRSADRIR